jgi:cell shape-determining protein MreC
MSILLNKYVLGSLIGILLLGFISYKIYSFGYTTASNQVRAQYEKVIADINAKTAIEMARQNEVAEQLNKLQNEQITDLRVKNEELDRIEKENEIEAAKDPNANALGIGADSVLRINRIR